MNTLQHDIERLAHFIVAHPRLVVLTGAGISAPSGIPTYRDQHGTWQHRSPIQEQAFLTEAQTRRRYWARSWYGWPLMRDATPNAAHHALAAMEAQGHIELLITQNVDSLHQRAGSRKVLDLHGAVGRVRCLGCAALHCREAIQQQLAATNAWPDSAAHQPRPDGDMEIPEAAVAQLVLPLCPLCGGDLKPDVVFFGGTVPREHVAACQKALAQADALLAIGSSLMVFSGFRFCRLAAAMDKPVVLINPGITRADDLASFKLSSLAAPLMSGTLDHLKQTVIHRPCDPGSPS